MAKKKKAVWLGVILDDPQKLLGWWESKVSPLLGKAYAHHSTVIYKPSPQDVLSARVGSPVRLKVVGVARDDKAQAVVVDGFDLMGRNRSSHITVATDGTSPAYSNELVEAGFEAVDGPTITGRVGFFDGSSDRFDFDDTVYEGAEIVPIERNVPIWVYPAVLAVAAVAGAVVWSSITSAPAEPTAAQIEAAQRAATTERLQAQLVLDNFAPVLTAAIPIMIAGGAFLLWKSRQEG